MDLDAWLACMAAQHKPLSLPSFLCIVCFLYICMHVYLYAYIFI